MSSRPTKPNRAIHSGFDRRLSHHGRSDLSEPIGRIKDRPRHRSCIAVEVQVDPVRFVRTVTFTWVGL